MKEKIIDAIQKIEKASQDKNTDYFCTSRDIFQARLDSYIIRTQQYLLSAIIGEIGNNTFDHNWDYAEGHLRGLYFNTDISNQIILGDFGRGVKKSLAAVRKCNTDLEAIKVAFTEQVSGRAPEQRGNGLKFVLESIKEKNWYLYFQSGSGCCIIEDGNVSFLETEVHFDGCFAFIKTGEK